MGTYEYMVADVFTDIPLEGNPVAVFMDSSGIPPERMQQIAQEMHLSETVFVLPAESDGDVRVRIFTPVNELPLLGIRPGDCHRARRVERGREIHLETAMGTVPFDLVRAHDGRVVSARMWQPVPSWEPYEHAEELLSGLGLVASTLPVEIYRNGPRHVFVGLDGVAALSHVDPDQRIWPSCRTWPPTASRVRARGGGCGCSRPPTAWWRTRPPVRPPAPLRCTSPGTV